MSVGLDIAEVRQDPSILNIGALVVDVGGAALPFVPSGAGWLLRSGRAAARVLSRADDVADVAKAASRADDVVDAVRTADKVYDATKSTDRVAFGLGKHPNHGYDGLIGRFADKIRAATWWDLYGSAPDTKTMAQQLREMMTNSKEIHFNLDGFKEYGTLDQWAKLGADGPGEGNWTAWEFYQVLSNDEFFKKATFYLDGKPYYGVRPLP